MTVFWVITLFLSSSLLFVIQPMVAKILLPIYGGAPAVWTICLLFFQGLILVSYTYVWVLMRWVQKYWFWVHGCLGFLSLFSISFVFTPSPNHGIPEFVILKDLVFRFGLPLLVIGSSAPLLQYVYAQSRTQQSRDPYFLYAISNAGSLLALLAYPIFLERVWGMKLQLLSWSWLYIVYLFLLCLILICERGKPYVFTASLTSFAVKKREIVYWIFMSFLPCSLMLGITFYITTDIAATPLFWVVPLALYLLTFIVSFAKRANMVSHGWMRKYAIYFLILPLIGYVLSVNHSIAWSWISLHLIGFFMLTLACHGELARTRPVHTNLTQFYCCIALGGLLAGLFNGLLAPRVFERAYEYPLVLYIIACVLLRSHIRRLIFSLIALSCFLFWSQTGPMLDQKRNFYGIKQVFEQQGAHVLLSQNTMHGFQWMDALNPTQGARSYYGVVTPIVEYLQQIHGPLEVMIVGLGTGHMACQFKPQDSVRMVEVDEQMIRIAQDPALFTYLRDCPAKVSIIHDDGRLAVNRSKSSSFDLLVMDAFQSDAIPVHLLTKEAFSIYQQKLKPNGVFLVNISNRHLRLLPILSAIGRHLEMIVLHQQSSGNPRVGELASEWVLLTTQERLASFLMAKGGWTFVTTRDTLLWTDDYSSIVPFIKWT